MFAEKFPDNPVPTQ